MVVGSNAIRLTRERISDPLSALWFVVKSAPGVEIVYQTFAHNIANRDKMFTFTQIK